MAHIAGTAAAKIAASLGLLSVTKSNLDRFLSEAEECVRQSEMALNDFDKRAWLELAEDWVKLARAVEERDI